MIEWIHLSWIIALLAIVILFFVPSNLKAYISSLAVFLSDVPLNIFNIIT